VNKDIDISVVIPTYNAEKSIYLLLKSLFRELTLLKLSFEIIIVDDNSSDDTINEIKKFNNNSETGHITVIKSSSNYGQITSTLLGVFKTMGKKILTIDDDLQHDPTEIKKLYKHMIKNDLDSVVACWEADETLVRNFSSTLFNFFSNLVQLKSPRYRNTAFRLMDSRLKQNFLDSFLDKNWIDIRSISKANDQVYVVHNPPFHRTHTSFAKRVKIALKFFLIDTYFFEILIIILTLLNYKSAVILLVLLQLLKRINKKRTLVLRKKLLHS
tara:strand:- start:1117 stop:1929 length:813 start_codon:yes stop_codon:yes gene_type:complete